MKKPPAIKLMAYHKQEPDRLILNAVGLSRNPQEALASHSANARPA